LQTRKLWTALFAVMALAVLVAGCGGGSDSTSSGSTEAESTESESSGGAAPTKTAFIKEADEICATADASLNEEISEYAEENKINVEKEPTEEQQIEIYEAVVLPNVGQQSDDLAALTPPEGDEETIEEITDSLSAGVEQAEENPQELVEGKNPLEDASKKAKAYGLKTCGNE
jgi:predicted lipid-binding transport protein (Tim44 family)